MQEVFVRTDGVYGDPQPYDGSPFVPPIDIVECGVLVLVPHCLEVLFVLNRTDLP